MLRLEGSSSSSAVAVSAGTAGAPRSGLVVIDEDAPPGPEDDNGDPISIEQSCLIKEQLLQQQQAHEQAQQQMAAQQQAQQVQQAGGELSRASTGSCRIPAAGLRLSGVGVAP